MLGEERRSELAEGVSARSPAFLSELTPPRLLLASSPNSNALPLYLSYICEVPDPFALLMMTLFELKITWLWNLENQLVSNCELTLIQGTLDLRH